MAQEASPPRLPDADLRHPDKWFVGERSEASYLDVHLIPNDPSLWKLERFDDFIVERKKLIRKKFELLLVPIPINSRTIEQPGTALDTAHS